MHTVQEIKSAIHALPPDEREKLIAELSAMLPELDGDAAWERIIGDVRPRSSLSSLLSEAAVESLRDPTAFAETSEAEFERHS